MDRESQSRDEENGLEREVNDSRRRPRAIVYQGGDTGSSLDDVFDQQDQGID